MRDKFLQVIHTKCFCSDCYEKAVTSYLAKIADRIGPFLKHRPSIILKFSLFCKVYKYMVVKCLMWILSNYHGKGSL